MPSSTLRARPSLAPSSCCAAAAASRTSSFFFCGPALVDLWSSRAFASPAPPSSKRRLPTPKQTTRDQEPALLPAHIHSFRAFRRCCPAVNPRLFDCATPEHHARTYPQPCAAACAPEPPHHRLHHRSLCCSRTASARSAPAPTSTTVPSHLSPRKEAYRTRLSSHYSAWPLQRNVTLSTSKHLAEEGRILQVRRSLAATS